ncbi:MAG: PKD domain-containing protein [Deltaproteobacteria bacterium]|nr:PKD domain-containing protein [Deltaproteobacteria bacterium]
MLRSVLARLALLLVSIAMPTISQAQGWQSVSPQTILPKSLYRVAVAADHRHAWAVDSTSARIYRTEDGSESWEEIAAGANPHYGLFFLDAQTGWAVGAGGEILSTSDRGASWAGGSQSAEDLYGIFFLDPTSGWAVGAGGEALEYTGAWSPESTGASPGATLYDVFFLDNQHGWVVGDEVYRYSSGAWLSGSAPETLRQVRFIDSQHGLAIPYVGPGGHNEYPNWCRRLSGDTLYYSDDNGLSWTSVLSPGFALVDLDRAFDGDLIAVDMGGGIHASADFIHWSAVADIDQTGTNAVDLRDGEFGVLVGIRGGCRATHDGASWEWLGTGTAEQIEALVFQGPNEGWYLAGMGPFYSDDAGAHWTVRPVRYGWECTDTVPNTFAYYHDMVLKPSGELVLLGERENNGRQVVERWDLSSWTSELITTTDELYFSRLAFPDDTHGWVVGLDSNHGDGEIWASQDGGATWAYQDHSPLGALRDVDFISPDEGWAVGDGGAILHYESGAWTSQSTGTRLDAICVEDTHHGIAVGPAGRYCSTPDGTNWSCATTSPSADLHAVDTFGDQGFAVGSGGRVFRASWTGSAYSLTLLTTLSGTLTAVQVLSGGLAYAANYQGRVYRYTDGPPPIADAGQDHAAFEDSIDTLDGSQSTGDCSWLRIDGRPEDAVVNPQPLTQPYTTPDVCEDTYLVFELRCTDPATGLEDRDKVVVQILNVQDTPPVAYIALQGPVDESAAFQLDGSGSFDDCGLTFAWIQTIGSSAGLGDVDQAILDVTAPRVCGDETIEFSLEVTDTIGQTDSQSVQVLVREAVDDPPMAQIDPPEPGIILETDSMQLDGSGSSDECGITRFDWICDDMDHSQYSGQSAEVGPFHVCGNTLVSCQLAVEDEHGGSDSAQVEIMVHEAVNVPPLAQIDYVPVGENVTAVLDGGSSSDECGIVRYTWTCNTAPESWDPSKDLGSSYRVCGDSVVDTCQLEVEDDQGVMDSTSIDVWVLETINDPPQAQIAQPDPVDEGDRTVLDGSGSSDECGVASWTWTCDDGPHTGEQPDVGPFRVCGDTLLGCQLVVTDDHGGSDSTQVEFLVREAINDPPQAQIAQPDPVDEGELVALDGSGSSDECGILSWEWTCDDGQHAGDQAEAGPFRVCGDTVLGCQLVVADEHGGSDSVLVEFLVREAIDDPPAADAGSDLLLGSRELVQLDGSQSSDDCGIVSYAWRQVDTSGLVMTLLGSHTASPRFILPEVETSAVLEFELTVTDAEGLIDTDTVQVTVDDGSAGQVPEILETANPMAVRGVAYAYDSDGRAEASGSAPISWSKLEGPEGLQIDPQNGWLSWLPEQAGQTQITIEAANENGTDSYTFSVQVSDQPAAPAPVAVILSDPDPAEGEAPLRVRFDGSGSSAPGSLLIGYSWDFGDDTPRLATSSDEPVEHVYLEPGGYTARLVVTNAEGSTGEAYVPISVTDARGHRPPMARILAEPLSGSESLTVSFDCDCWPGDAAIIAWLWDFGDRSSSTAQSVEHSYGPGRYRVRLAILDANGLGAMDHVDVEVGQAERSPPLIDAGAEPSSGPAPLRVWFIGLAADPDGVLLSRSWDFGDGERFEQERVGHVYSAPGTYLATFTALSDSGLQASASVEIQVTTAAGELAPKIISLPNTEAAPGEAYRYDTDGVPAARGTPEISWQLGKSLAGELVGAPEGMTVDPSTGEISWTPADGQAGSVQRVALSARNTAGTDLQEYEIQVAGERANDGCGCASGSTGASGSLLLLLGLGILTAHRRRC